MQEHNPYAPPQSEVELVEVPAEAAPRLWNPNAAACWSLLFSPIFGALVHMKNWQALGEPEKAAKSMRWALGCLAFFVGLGLLSGVVDEKVLDGIGRAVGIALLVSWYYALGKPQQKYVIGKFGEKYPRRGWALPLLLGVAGAFALIIAMTLLAALAASIIHP